MTDVWDGNGEEVSLFQNEELLKTKSKTMKTPPAEIADLYI